MRVDWSKISNEAELHRTFNQLMAESPLDTEEFSAFEKRRIELAKASNDWIEKLSDDEVEELLKRQNEHAAEQWQQSDEGRYRTLAVEILVERLPATTWHHTVMVDGELVEIQASQPPGVGMPQTVMINGKLESIPPDEKCGLRPQDDAKLWLIVNEELPGISLEVWQKLTVGERISYLEALKAKSKKATDSKGETAEQHAQESTEQSDGGPANDSENEKCLIHPAIAEPPAEYRVGQIQKGEPLGPVTGTRTSLGFVFHPKDNHNDKTYRRHLTRQLESKTVWAKRSVDQNCEAYIRASKDSARDRRRLASYRDRLKVFESRGQAGSDGQQEAATGVDGS